MTIVLLVDYVLASYYTFLQFIIISKIYEHLLLSLLYNFEGLRISYIQYVTVLVKTRIVQTKTEFNFIAAVYRHTQFLSIPIASSVKC